MHWKGFSAHIYTLVSAGFDAAKGDKLGECEVTPDGYAHMTHMLASLAGGKLVVALEVGTHLTEPC
jgi:histone deacetylase 6